MVRNFFLLLIFYFIIFQISLAQTISVSSFNQTQTINITGNASTINQTTINSYLNVNKDGLTWDVSEAAITLAPLRNSTMGGDTTPPEAWTTATTVTSGTATYGYNTTGGNPAPSYFHKATSTATKAADITFYTNQSFSYDGSPSVVTLSWDYQILGNSFGTGNQINITLYRPDGSIAVLDTITFSAAVSTWTRRTININPANFTQAGTYVIQLRSRLVTAAKGTSNFVQAQYDNVFLNFTKYQLSVEHNATVSYNGTLRNISVLINFTSTNSKIFNMSIYDFANSNWVACQNISASPNIYYDIWCNISSLSYNPTNFISSDGKIRVRLNTTMSNVSTTLKEEYVQFYVFYSIGYLEVKLISPDVTTINYIIQNQTFWVNASVTCRNGNCGIVNGTALYNLTSSYPDTPINTTYGDKPFFINETQASATKTCGELLEDQNCTLSWLVNATGDVYTAWKIAVNFSSSFSFINQNVTENATVKILPCPIDFTLTWNSVDFGILNPSTQGNPAPGNSQLLYNITVNPGSCNLDFYIKGDDLYSPQTNTYLKISNMTFSNTTNSYSSSFRLLNAYQLLFFNVTPGNYTTYYWIDVPPIYAGTYTSTIYILGVLNGGSP